MNPLRLTYVCADRGVPVFGTSGSSTHIREMVGALHGRGNQVTVFAATLSDGHSLPDPNLPVVALDGDTLLVQLRLRLAKQRREAGLPVVVASEAFSLLANQTLARELERRAAQLDVVYERQSLWSLAGLQFARAHGLPFILEVNAPLSEQQEDYRELQLRDVAIEIERILLAEADRVVVTSPALRDYVHAQGASRRSVRILPCGVPSAWLGLPARAWRGAGDPFVVGFVGSLKPWHGIDTLLDAFLQLTYKSDLYRLLIVGDGPLLPYIREFAQRHHIADRVELTGQVPFRDVVGHLRRMDVGVAPYPELPSFYFSPLKIWEYAATEVPIVASASGHLGELFPHREAALLHKPGSIGKIVKHIEALRRNPESAQRLARRARRVAKEHTWDRLAARLEGLVRNTLSGALEEEVL